MDASFFFKVWDIYQSHWGHEEQRQLKKRNSASQLEKRLRKSLRMKGIYRMHHLLKMMWETEDVPPEELLHLLKTVGKACMGEEDMCDHGMDSYTRMIEDIHIYHPSNCLSVEQRQWQSLRKPMSTHIGTDTPVYGLAAILVLPLCSI